MKRIIIPIVHHEEKIAKIANHVGNIEEEIHHKLGDSIAVMRLAVDWAYEFMPIHAGLIVNDEIDEWIETLDAFTVDKIEELLK